jgi:hypothetical protein
MVAAAQQAMRAGALGLSTGLAYPPACYAERSELVQLARVVKEEGGILAAHVRSEGDGDPSRHRADAPAGGGRSGAPRLRAGDGCQGMTGNHRARNRYPGGPRGRTRPALRTR